MGNHERVGEVWGLLWTHSSGRGRGDPPDGGRVVGQEGTIWMDRSKSAGRGIVGRPESRPHLRLRLGRREIEYPSSFI